MFEQVKWFKFSFSDEADKVRRFIDERTMAGIEIGEAEKLQLVAMSADTLCRCPFVRCEVTVSGPNHIVRTAEDFQRATDEGTVAGGRLRGLLMGFIIHPYPLPDLSGLQSGLCAVTYVDIASSTGELEPHVVITPLDFCTVQPMDTQAMLN